MKVTMLGCGASNGVPSLARGFAKCNPKNPKNYRLRPSILLEENGVRLLVDTSPDLRAQALRAGLKTVDAILYTHTHADHTHGIDDVRGFFYYRDGHAIPAYAYPRDLEELERRFPYIFRHIEGSFYKPLLEGVSIAGPFTIGPFNIIPFEQDHGDVISLGFRAGRFAYTTDVRELSENALKILEGVEVWIVDCLLLEPHPSHAHLDKVLEWVARVKPKRTILTHMSAMLDYDALKKILPKGIEPGYDGLEIVV